MSAYSLDHAGALQLVTRPLMDTLVKHSVGNLRLLNTMAGEPMTVGAEKELGQVDEKLFLDLYAQASGKARLR